MSASVDPATFTPVERCPWCGATDATPIATRVDGIEVHRCPHCDLAYTSRLPDDLGVFYDEGYFGRHAAPGDDDALTGYEDYDNSYTLSTFRWLALLLRSVSRGSRLLDVGAATGTFLAAAVYEGFDVVGNELSSDAARVAQGRGLDVVAGPFDPSVWEAASFDVITALEVVEHVRDPRVFLEQLASLVTPGGVLCFLVPNVPDRLLQRFGDDYREFHKSLEHTLYFNPDTLTRVCDELFGQDALTLLTFDVPEGDQEVSYALAFVRVGEAPAHRPERALVDVLSRSTGIDGLEGADPAGALGVALTAAKFFDFELAEQAIVVARVKGASDLAADTAHAQILRNGGQLYRAMDLVEGHVRDGHIGGDALAGSLLAEVVRDVLHMVRADAPTLSAGLAQLADAAATLPKREADVERIQGSLTEVSERADAATRALESATADAAQLRSDLEARDELLAAERAARVAEEEAREAERRELESRAAALEDELQRRAASLEAELASTRADADRWVAEAQTLVNEVESARTESARAAAARENADRRSRLAFGRAQELESQLNALYDAKAWRVVSALWATKRALTPGRRREDDVPQVEPQPLPELPADASKATVATSVVASVAPRRRRHTGPLVSVIVPVYNKGPILLDAIASLDAQTLTDLEIVLWDDGSTDGPTLEAIEHLHQHPRVRAFRGPNRGVIEARNSAMAVGRGRFFCCLDPDDRMAPTYLEKAVTLLDSGEDVDVVYPWMRTVGDKEEIWQTQDLDPALIAEVNHVPICAVFRREVFEETGGFSPEMGEGYEDWEFWAHVAERGFRGRVIPESLFEYEFSESTDESRDASARAKHLELATRISALHPMLRSAPDQLARPPVDAYSAPGAIRQLPRSFPEGSVRPIVLTLPWFTVGGADRVVEDLITHWRAQGRTVIALTTVPLGDGMLDRFDELLELTPYAYCMDRLGPRDRWLEVLAGILDALPDDATLLNIGSPWLYGVMAEVRRAHPALRIVDQQFNDIGHADGNRSARDHIDVTVAAYGGLADTLRADGRGDAAVDVVYVGIDEPAASAEPVGDVRKRLGLPSDRPVVSFVGRFSVEKRPEWMVRYAEDAARRNVHVCFIGDGPEAPLLAKRIAGLRNVTWHRSVDDVDEVLRVSDVLALSSRTEGIPLVAMEALAVGTPVVATAVGGLPELADVGGVTLCDPDDYASFAAAIEGRLGDDRADEVTLPDRFTSKYMLDQYDRLVDVTDAN